MNYDAETVVILDLILEALLFEKRLESVNEVFKNDGQTQLRLFQCCGDHVEFLLSQKNSFILRGFPCTAPKTKVTF